METSNKINVQNIGGKFIEIKEIKEKVELTKEQIRKAEKFKFKHSNCKILNIEASAIRTNGTNDITIKKTKKYEGSFDNSSEMTELERIYKSFKVGNEAKMFYADAKGHKRTDLIINLSFNTVSNKVVKDIYTEDGEEMLIVDLKISELRKNLYLDGFKATINGVTRTYRKYKRSCGSSREGNCIFLWENLIPLAMLWTNMGIPLKLHKLSTPELPDFQLPQYESYIALTMSSAIDSLNIPNNSIMIVDDQFSTFTEKVMETKAIDKIVNGERVLDKKGNVVQELETEYNDKFEVRNNLWDGMSLLDKSLMGKYSDKGFILVRNNWIKSACFNSNVSDWFEDNKITTIEQLRKLCPTMITLATEISQIKMITTRSSLKMAKFPEIMDITTFLKKLSSTFSVIKYEKDTKFMNGDYVKTSYQLCQTLNMKSEELDSFLKPTTKYINELKKDDNIAFRNYLKMKINNDIEDEELTSNDEFMLDMLSKSDKFFKAEVFKTFKQEVIGKLKVEAKTGRIMVKGTYAVMVSCPILMLQYAIGQWKEGMSDVINPRDVICSKFSKSDIVAMVRSPHIVSGNLLTATVVENELINTYMNLTSNIIVVSSIKNNIQQTLNSCDWDSDSALITTSKEILASILRDFNNFLVPCTNIDGEKSKYKYCLEDMATMDSIASNSQKLIGQIVNLSANLNSLMFHNINNGKSIESQEPLYLQLCSLAIMSGLAIDGSKKTFSFDLMKELNKIRKNWGDKVELDVLDKKGKVVCDELSGEVLTKKTTHIPNFFKWLKEDKIDARRFKSYNCTMDKIATIIEHDVKEKGNGKTIQLMQLLKTGIEGRKAPDEKEKKFIEDVRKLNADSKALFKKQTKKDNEEFTKNTKDDKYTKLDALNKDFIESHKNKLNAKTIEAIILEEGHKDTYKDIKRKLINMLFLCHKATFKSMFNISITIEDVQYLVRLDNIIDYEKLVYEGKDIIELYGIKYLIVTTNRELDSLNENKELVNFSEIIVKSADKETNKLKNV